MLSRLGPARSQAGELAQRRDRVGRVLVGDRIEISGGALVHVRQELRAVGVHPEVVDDQGRIRQPGFLGSQRQSPAAARPYGPVRYTSEVINVM